MKFPGIASGLLTLSFLFGAGAWTGNAQSANETVIVTMTDDVMVGKTLLPRGEYRITNASPVSPLLQFFSNDRLRYEANALGVRTTAAHATNGNTALVLEKIGATYYLREIWVGGRTAGLEIPLPERAKKLKRELELTASKEPERLIVPAVVAR